MIQFIKIWAFYFRFSRKIGRLILTLRKLANFTLVLFLFKILVSSILPFSDMIGMLHVGVFILLVLSGERNFSVRLNKPYSSKVPMDIPRLSKGTHADLLFLVRKLA